MFNHVFSKESASNTARLCVLGRKKRRTPQKREHVQRDRSNHTANKSRVTTLLGKKKASDAENASRLLPL